MGGLVGQSSR